MKRCPQCNRVESDDALAFCRADGTALISDSGSISGDVGTAKFGAGSVSSEIETSVLPHPSTTPEMVRSTGPTTLLSTQIPVTTGALAKPRRRKTAIAVVVIVTAIVAAASAIVVDSYLSRKRAKSIESIAVMPFVNESGNQDLDYLSDGMTESLITSLSQLPNLNVKARSTVFRYKGKATDAKTIGKDLNVQAILNGRVVQRGEQLTLSLELIDAQTENVIWSDRYDRKQTDLVNLQSEIARDVSSKLKLKLSGAEAQKLAKTYTTDPEAYRLYLQGRFYLNKRVGKEFDKAESYFQQAIAKDPNFALGYVGVAEFLGERDRPKAKEYILRALAIDNQLSDAHASLGYQLLWRHSPGPLRSSADPAGHPEQSRRLPGGGGKDRRWYSRDQKVNGAGSDISLDTLSHLVRLSNEG